MPATTRRRRLRFETIDDALAEAERLVAAERERRLDRVGNWTLGQALGHLATWANFAFDGFPSVVRVPLPVRVVARLMRGRILAHDMRSGVRLRGVPSGTLGLDEMDAGEGLTRFCGSMERLRSTAPEIDNPVFGRLTHEQWVQLNLHTPNCTSGTSCRSHDRPNARHSDGDVGHELLKPVQIGLRRARSASRRLPCLEG